MSAQRFFANESEEYTNYDEFIVRGKDGIHIGLKDDLKAIIKTAVLKIIADVDNDASKGSFDKHDISVYTGTAGIALLHLRLFKVLHDEKYLESALKYVKSALKRLKGKRITFLCGDAGPLAVGAVIYEICGEAEKSMQCVRRLVGMTESVLSTDEEVCDELLYGRAGFLYALMFVNKNLSEPPVPQRTIEMVMASIIESGKDGAAKPGCSPTLMYTWHSKAYLGAAHGLSGIFHTLLLAESHQYYDLIKSGIDFILGMQFPSGNFPSSLGNKDDKLIHWCHGAPGCVYLMLKAYETFDDAKYLDAARSASNAIWSRGLLKKGYGLCHGASGNGYGFLAMYKLTHEIQYLFRAIQFGLWCSGYRERSGMRTPDRPYSLFEGIGGSAFFLADLLDVDNAKFPAFEL